MNDWARDFYRVGPQDEPLVGGEGRALAGLWRAHLSLPHTGPIARA